LQSKRKVSVNDIRAMKGIEKITVLTGYDYPISSICDRAGVDVLLVGDSAGMVMLGYSSTIPVGMNEMKVFCGAVARGAKHAMIVGDMPFGSYQSSPNVAVENAVQLIKAGCDAVKLEGGAEIVDTIKAIVGAGIPTMGHIGLKPQTSSLWEGYRVQGKTKESAMKLIKDAKELEKAGVFSIVLEMVASEVADEITISMAVPTIGIGAGAGCDGQVLVLHDMLGIYEDIKPKFAKRYAEMSKTILDAVSTYGNEIRTGIFPGESNTFHMAADEVSIFRDELKKKKEK
jgi:3-methyl-2-oxobutanoate hydroxymethyltransferase